MIIDYKGEVDVAFFSTIFQSFGDGECRYIYFAITTYDSAGVFFTESIKKNLREFIVETKFITEWPGTKLCNSNSPPEFIGIKCVLTNRSKLTLLRNVLPQFFFFLKENSLLGDISLLSKEEKEWFISILHEKGPISKQMNKLFQN